MKNKGFTLAEMLGVITILAILGLLIFPIVDKSIKDGKKDLYNVQIGNIEQGAKDWVSDNIFIAPSTNGEKMKLTLYQLKQAGKVDKNITNPIDKFLFPNDMIIEITKEFSDYKVDLLTDTGVQTELKKYSPYTPTLKLNGNEVVYLEYSHTNPQTYNDPFVTATSSEGYSITSEVTYEIFDSYGNVMLREAGISSNQIGIYYIYYDVESHDIKARVIRTVIVKDTKPPVISLPSTTTITTSQTASYNLLTGVTASDESEVSEIRADRTSLPSVAGTYTVTYTATDTHGNASSARRTIIVE